MRRDLSLAADGERQVIFQERLEALTEKRAGMEAELNRLEQELTAPNFGILGPETRLRGLPTLARLLKASHVH